MATASPRASRPPSWRAAWGASRRGPGGGCPIGVGPTRGGTSESMSTVMRSLAVGPVIAAVPDLVLAGPHAAEIRRAEFRRGDLVVAAVPVVRRRIAWPHDAAPLARGDY